MVSVLLFLSAVMPGPSPKRSEASRSGSTTPSGYLAAATISRVRAFWSSHNARSKPSPHGSVDKAVILEPDIAKSAGITKENDQPADGKTSSRHTTTTRSPSR